MENSDSDGESHDSQLQEANQTIGLKHTKRTTTAYVNKCKIIDAFAVNNFPQLCEHGEVQLPLPMTRITDRFIKKLLNHVSKKRDGNK